MQILIAFATEHGSTADIAHFMGEIMRAQGHTVTVNDVRHITSLEGFDVIVPGAPIYSGMWLKSLSLFFRRYEAELARLPMYLWITCIRVLESGGREHAIRHYIQHDAVVDFDVREVMVFAGRVDRHTISPDERWTLALRYDGAQNTYTVSEDYRNWETVEAWAQYVAHQVALLARTNR